MEARSSIPAGCAQEILESAKNASDKGLSQYETPLSLAKILRTPLPKWIEVVCDLTAGHGQLAGGVADGATKDLLLCEIQRVQNVKLENRPLYQSLEWHRITGDVTKVYPLLKEINWQGDCFTLNPPFDLHFHKSNLEQLAHSDMEDIRTAYAADDPRVGRKQIDSTIATILIALDRMTHLGEGFLIGNNSTLERLIFAAKAPYGNLKKYVWLRIILDGNPMTKRDGDAWNEGFQTGIIYFARSHENGPQMTLDRVQNEEDLKNRLRIIPDIRHRLRNGPSVFYAEAASRGSTSTWEAVKAEWDASQRSKRTDYNIWLEEGIITRAALSTCGRAKTKFLSLITSRVDGWLDWVHHYRRGHARYASSMPRPLTMLWPAA